MRAIIRWGRRHFYLSQHSTPCYSTLSRHLHCSMCFQLIKNPPPPLLIKVDSQIGWNYVCEQLLWFLKIMVLVECSSMNDPESRTLKTCFEIEEEKRESFWNPSLIQTAAVWINVKGRGGRSNVLDCFDRELNWLQLPSLFLLPPPLHLLVTYMFSKE